MMRWAYIGAGASALIASASMTIKATGGVTSPGAPGIVALVLILLVGAAAIGSALARGHTTLAVVIGAGLLAGEMGTILQTAQRVTAAREATRAPLALQAARRRVALDELAVAEADTPKRIDRSRLTSAEAAMALADAAVRDKSAEKTCLQNCRILLQAAAANALREVEGARKELASSEAAEARRISDRVEKARSALAAVPAPESPTPLADDTGIPEWLLDTLEAVALAVAINLPASALIALGVKMSGPKKRQEAEDIPDGIATAAALTASPRGGPTRSPNIEAQRFCLASLEPDLRGKVSTRELHETYIRWCAAETIAPLPIETIAPALGRLFRGAGIDVDRGVAVGVRVKSASFDTGKQLSQVMA